MKHLLTILAVIISATTSGQTANDFLQSGISKHNSKDYKSAIEDYTQAITADKNFRDAYYNRGVCEQAIQDKNSAKKDFDKTIEIDPKFAKVFYSRATLLVSDEKYLDALPDLDKAIEIDPTLPNALNLRGQIRVQSGNKIGGCEDFLKAKENGDDNADKYISKFCGNKQELGESLALDWPDAENWKIGDDQENEEQHVIDLIHSNETIDKWTELGNMTSIKGVTGVPVDKTMHLMFEQAKQMSPKAKLTFIEKDEKAEYPWIIFTIESPNFVNDNTPESQLWYVVQGKQGLYTNFRAVKKATIAPDLKDKWIKFFKTGKIVSK